MINHSLFPVLVSEFHYKNHQIFKEIFLESLFNHLDEDGRSHETTGHITVHHEKRFEEIYRFITNSVKKFIQNYNVNPDLFDINIVKSWLNILASGQSNPVHGHNDAHISFVYYVSVPENIQSPIRFHNYERRYEPYQSFCRVNNQSNVWDTFNSYAWQFIPKDGQLMVFPADLRHDVIGEGSCLDSSIKTLEDAKNRRISIAGDVLLTYKEKSTSPLGLQPIFNWRRFDD